MLFLIAFVIAFCTAYFGDKVLKKYPYAFYITAAVITVIVVIFSQTIAKNRDIQIPDFVNTYLIGIFSKGAIAAAFWCIVMWTGALPNGSALIKKFMPVRGELSILAATVTLAHAITYSITYIKTLILNIQHDRPLAADFIITCIVCIVLMLIMIPLTVMSFKTVRKKMNPKTWKNIQRTAYAFYALIYIHIMVLYVPQARNGKTDKFISIIVYSIVFLTYAVFRLRKLYVKKTKTENTKTINAICALLSLILVGIAGGCSYGKSPEKPAQQQTSQNQPVVTTELAVSTTTAAEEQIQTTIASETTDISSTTEVSSISTDSAENTDTNTTSSGSETGTVTTVVTTTATTQNNPENETENDENNGEQQPEENQEENNNQSEEQNQPQDEPQQNQPEPEPEPEPVYIFRNGTYEGTAFGYIGNIHVTITIENDVITSISAYADADADDGDYYYDAEAYVLPQIQNSMSADGIDACSGATFSSDGLINAARQALNSARN